MSNRLGLVAGVAALAAALGAAAVMAPAGLAPARAQERSACTPVVDKRADPSVPKVMNLGETTHVTLEFSATCPPEKAPTDVMLVMDTSASMADDRKLVFAKSAAKKFLGIVLEAASGGTPDSRIGLVIFNHQAGLASPLTYDIRVLEAKIDAMMPTGLTNISDAIDIGREELLKDPQGHKQAMIVLTDGVNTVPTDPVPVAAQRAKDAGVLVITICAGGECDPGLQPAASRPDLYYDVPDASKLEEIYTQLAAVVQLNEVKSITVTDRVPKNMRYVPDSAVPAPSSVTREPSGETVLVWTLAGQFPPGGIGYDLEPLETGEHPTNVRAVADFVDRKGLPGGAEFPVPRVIVRADCPPVPLEVFFLIDDSNCLAGASLNGMDSRTAIRMGVERVLDQIQLTKKDTAAVIGYGDTAIIFQTLTDNRQAILAGVDAITMRDNSARLDLAYREVSRELRSTRHRAGTQVLTINVTDGPMMQSPDLAREFAAALNRQGVRHGSIAVGTIAQYALLREIAEPGWFWELAFGGDVITPYTEFGAIAAGIGMPASPCPVVPTPASATATPRPSTPPTPQGPTATVDPRQRVPISLPILQRN